MIDDDAAFLEIVARTLTQANHEVVCTQSGNEGIEQYSKLQPELVLLDLIMPEMDGLEVLSAIRKLDPAAAAALSHQTAIASGSKPDLLSRRVRKFFRRGAHSGTYPSL